MMRADADATRATRELMRCCRAEFVSATPYYVMLMMRAVVSRQMRVRSHAMRAQRVQYALCRFMLMHDAAALMLLRMPRCLFLIAHRCAQILPLMLIAER